MTHTGEVSSRGEADRAESEYVSQVYCTAELALASSTSSSIAAQGE